MATQPFLPFDDEPEPAPRARAASQDARLIDELARVCGEQPLVEKVLVAPSLPIGHQLLERLAREGHPWMNLRVETVRTLAHAPRRRRPRPRGTPAALASPGARARRAGVRRGADRRSPTSGRCAACPGSTVPSSARSTSCAPPGSRPAPCRRPPSRTAASAGSSRRSSARYDEALATGRFVDAAEVLRRAAADGAEAGRSAPAPLFLLPDGSELCGLERAVLERVAGAGS